MNKMMDEKTLAYIRWYFRTDSIEDDMVYIDSQSNIFNWLFMDGDEYVTLNGENINVDDPNLKLLGANGFVLGVNNTVFGG